MTTDWRSKKMSQIRDLIKQADPDVVEEIKYKTPSNPGGIPVWYDNGMICTGETYKNHLRLTFSKGNLLKEKHKLFNHYRAITISEEDVLDEEDFKLIIKEAVELNKQKKK